MIVDNLVIPEEEREKVRKEKELHLRAAISQQRAVKHFMRKYMNCLNLPAQRIAFPDFVDVDSDGEEEEAVKKELMDRTSNAQLNLTDDDDEIGILCEQDTLKKMTRSLKIRMKERKITFKENTLPSSQQRTTFIPDLSLTTDKQDRSPIISTATCTGTFLSFRTFSAVKTMFFIR